MLIVLVLLVGFLSPVDTFTGFIPKAVQGTNLAHFAYPLNLFFTPALYQGCEQAHRAGFKQPGVYPIHLKSGNHSRWSFILCNNTRRGGASTVILYRRPGGVNFQRSFKDYEEGFGSAKADYFLGLRYIRELTRKGFNKLVVTILDADGNLRQIRYSHFNIKSGPAYTLGLASPGVGDLPDDLWFHRNRPFTAPGHDDKRRDGMSCSKTLKRGWWYLDDGACALTLLTGSQNLNRTRCHSMRPFAMCDTLYWLDWSGYLPLTVVTMELMK